ncbi:MAG: HAMP domain-containing protein [Bacillota bacterium]|nr:HAMP domain-containing protein [Bacillota bacterium]
MNRMYSSKQAMRYLVTDQQNKVVADSASADIGEEVDGTSADLRGYPITLTNGEKIGNIYISSPISKGIESLENTFLYNISIQTIISIIMVSFVALLLGPFLTRGIVLPLSELSGGIHALAKGNLWVRVKPRGDKELYSLGEDFNQMAEKVSFNFIIPV